MSQINYHCIELSEDKITVCDRQNKRLGYEHKKFARNCCVIGEEKFILQRGELNAI